MLKKRKKKDYQDFLGVPCRLLGLAIKEIYSDALSLPENTCCGVRAGRKAEMLDFTVNYTRQAFEINSHRHLLLGPNSRKITAL